MKLNPYLHFKGNAEEALNFYATCLNGEITQIGRYGDTSIASDEDWKQKIMHARLVFGNNLIMLSDVFKGQEVSTEGNVQLSVEVDNFNQLETVFNKMADGGVVSMALQDTFWGARFGMLKDKFGISWMFNCEQQK